MSEIQRLTQSRNKGYRHEKEVHLSSVEGDGRFCEKCRNCGKVCEYQAKECKKHEGKFTVVMPARAMGAIPVIVQLLKSEGT
jgi:MinD superfamily P-loop ATPase